MTNFHGAVPPYLHRVWPLRRHFAASPYTNRRRRWRGESPPPPPGASWQWPTAWIPCTSSPHARGLLGKYRQNPFAPLGAPAPCPAPTASLRNIQSGPPPCWRPQGLTYARGNSPFNLFIALRSAVVAATQIPIATAISTARAILLPWTCRIAARGGTSNGQGRGPQPRVRNSPFGNGKIWTIRLRPRSRCHPSGGRYASTGC